MTSQTAGSAEGHPLIRTPDQRVRVFVSSTLKELAAERIALAATADQATSDPFPTGSRGCGQRSRFGKSARPVKPWCPPPLINPQL